MQNTAKNQPNNHNKALNEAVNVLITEDNTFDMWKSQNMILIVSRFGCICFVKKLQIDCRHYFFKLLKFLCLLVGKACTFGMWMKLNFF